MSQSLYQPVEVRTINKGERQGLVEGEQARVTHIPNQTLRPWLKLDPVVRETMLKRQKLRVSYPLLQSCAMRNLTVCKCDPF